MLLHGIVLDGHPDAAVQYRAGDGTQAAISPPKRNARKCTGKRPPAAAIGRDGARPVAPWTEGDQVAGRSRVVGSHVVRSH
jgi:hypothetical protein